MFIVSVKSVTSICNLQAINSMPLGKVTLLIEKAFNNASSDALKVQVPYNEIDKYHQIGLTFFFGHLIPISMFIKTNKLCFVVNLFGIIKLQ